MSDLSPVEQYFLELINRARSDPNAEAARFGIGLNDGVSGGQISGAAKQPLAANDLLGAAATGHNLWMLATNTFSHTGEGGSDVGDRIEDAGYVDWRRWGENIARRTATSEMEQVIERLHEQLFRSAGHRKNLLNGSFDEIGLSVEMGAFNGRQNAIATQNFASDGGDPFLLGVVYDDLNGDGFFNPGEELPGVSVSVVGEGTVFTGPGGGYEIRVDDNQTLNVTFSGDGLGQVVTKRLAIGSENVKLDVLKPEEVSEPVDPPAPTEPPAPSDPPPGDPPGPEDPVGNDTPTPKTPTTQPEEPSPETPAPPPMVGGGGADVLRGTENADVIRGKGGADVLRGKAGADHIKWQGGADRMFGGGGDDTLLGGGGRDMIKGGGGADLIDGQGGGDVLYGGGGADRFLFTKPRGRDVIEDFGRGADVIETRLVDTFDELTFAQRGDHALVGFGGAFALLRNTDVSELTEDDFLFA